MYTGHHQLGKWRTLLPDLVKNDFSYRAAIAFLKHQAANNVQTIPSRFFGRAVVSSVANNTFQLPPPVLINSPSPLVVSSTSSAKGSSAKRSTHVITPPSPSIENARQGKEIKYAQSYRGLDDSLKDLSKLPVLHISDSKCILEVHNNNSKKAPVATVRLCDDSLAVIKLMKKSFGYGNHQNFIQHIKDANLCGFKHMHPTPGSEEATGRPRGLMFGRFDVVKTED